MRSQLVSESPWARSLLRPLQVRQHERSGRLLDIASDGSFAYVTPCECIQFLTVVATPS